MIFTKYNKKIWKYLKCILLGESKSHIDRRSPKLTMIIIFLNAVLYF